MPLFEYTCIKCKKQYEVLVKLKDLDKMPDCPHCGNKLKKIMSAPMFIIK